MAHSHANAAVAAPSWNPIPASSAHLYTHAYMPLPLPHHYSHSSLYLPDLDPDSHSPSASHGTLIDDHADNDQDDLAAISYYTPVAWVHFVHYPSPSFFLSPPKHRPHLPTPPSAGPLFFSPASAPTSPSMTALPGYEDFSLFGDEPLLPPEPSTSAPQPIEALPASSTASSASALIIPSSTTSLPPPAASMRAPSSSAAPAPSTSTAATIGGMSFLPEWHPTSLLSPSFTPATVFDSPDMGYDASALFSPALLDSAASPYMADAASPLLGEDAAASFASALPHAAAQLFPDLAVASSSAPTSQPPPTSSQPVVPPVSRATLAQTQPSAQQVHQQQIHAWAQQQAAHAQAALRQQQQQQQQQHAQQQYAAAAAAARMQGMVAVPAAAMHSPAMAQWYSPAAVTYAAFPTTAQQPLGQASLIRPAAAPSAMASPYLAIQSSFGGAAGSPLMGNGSSMSLIAPHPQPMPTNLTRAPVQGMMAPQMQQQLGGQHRPAQQPPPQQQQAKPASSVSNGSKPATVAPTSAASSAPGSTTASAAGGTTGKGRAKASPNVTTAGRGRKRPAPDYDGTATTAAVAAALAAQAQAQADAAAAARAAAASAAQAQAPAGPNVNGLGSPPRPSTSAFNSPGAFLAPHAAAHGHSPAQQAPSPMVVDSNPHSPMSIGMTSPASQSLTPDPAHASGPPPHPPSSTTSASHPPHTYRATSSLSDIPHATSPPLTAHSDTSGTASATVDSLPSLDPVARKRAKNTDAARRSRLKKMQRMETLEERVQQLEDENKQLVLQLAVCDNDKKNWAVKEEELKARIAYLEDKLFAGMATATAAAVRAQREQQQGGAAGGAAPGASPQAPGRQ